MTGRCWLILAVLAATCWWRPPLRPVAGRTVTHQITIHYSHFDPTALTVPHGVPVTFVLSTRTRSITSG